MRRPIIHIDRGATADDAAATAIYALRAKSPALSVGLPSDATTSDIAGFQSRCSEVARSLAAPVEVLDCGQCAPPRFTGFAHHDRDALAHAVAWLTAARAIGANVIVAPTFAPRDAAQPDFSYAQAIADTYRLLSNLRHEAEERGIQVWIDAPRPRFLLSPVETADLLDRVASHAIGARLCLAEAARISEPRDWQGEWGRRMCAIYIEPPPAAPNILTFCDALARMAPAGPIVFSPAACRSGLPDMLLQRGVFQ